MDIHSQALFHKFCTRSTTKETHFNSENVLFTKMII